MERLTHKIVYDNEHCQYVFDYNQDSEVGTKLGELEDVLEKYGFESVEKLEDYLTPKLFCYAKLSENLDELKKYCQCEPIIHIDTCEPQIELITDKVKDLEQELAELKQKAIVPKKIVNDFYDEIRHRAILEDDYCPDHNFERKYGLRKCVLEDIRSTILKKYGGEDDLR